MDPDWLFDYNYLFKQFRSMYTPPPTNTQAPSSVTEPLLMQSIINSLSEVRLPAEPSNRIAPPVVPPPDPMQENNQVVDNPVPQAADSTELVEVEDVSDTNSDDSFQTANNVEQHQVDHMIAAQAAPSVVESFATPPSQEEETQVAATVDGPASSDSSNTASTHIDAIVVLYCESL